MMKVMMTMITNDYNQEDTDLSSGLGWPDPTLTGEPVVGVRCEIAKKRE